MVNSSRAPFRSSLLQECRLDLFEATKVDVGVLLGVLSDWNLELAERGV